MAKRSFLVSSAMIVSIFSILAISCKSKKPVIQQEQEITLVMAEVNPDGTISAEMDKAFKQKVEELSGGKIKIDLQMGGTLGDEESVMALLKKPNSSIHLERISAFTLTAHGCQKSSLLTIPFTFSGKEHFWNFAASPFATEILDEPYEKGVGVKGLFYGEEGFRHFFSTKPLSGTEDFAGLKLRITPDAIMKGVADGLKADPLVVGFGDLYGALQTGIVDAAEQPIANYLGNKFHMVAPYMILDGHTMGVTEVVITSECWDSLTEKQRAILKEAGTYAGEICRKISQEAEDKARAQLVEEGAKFIEVNDIAPWQNACEKIITQSAAVAPELYKEILNLAH
ncbi:MAG: TRAP transporter substrate-binding protein [Treponema sp.]|nr:TRAP transporter substrate-binding protein [Treponema sp.]